MLLAQLQDRGTLLDKTAGMKISNPALYVHYKSLPNFDTSLINKLRWLPAKSSYEKYFKSWQEDLDLTTDDLQIDSDFDALKKT